ncbi:tail fiber domain-containing protein [Flavobacterium mesophilum]|uniref:tail fiber domain-containing protein n=1 Tax=Flavobacterium mesophilum TaxID=3143495 RepID=UPI0031DA2A64
MNKYHNRIKVADLETNEPNKILATNGNGELEFSDITYVTSDAYNGLDYNIAGKSLDARQGKVLKNLIDNINSILVSDNPNLNTLQELVNALQVVQNSLNTILVNNLTTGGTSKALTAEMGKTLQNNKVDKVSGKSLLSDNEISRLATLSNYTHPANHPPEIILQDPNNRFVSDAEKAIWNAKQTNIAVGTTAQYYRGDKTWQTLDKTATGLPNVDNTADANKSVLSASKLTTPRTINNVAFDGSANITINAVDATARIPVSEKGAANGVATLDASGIILTTQLPSYVDDVLEFTNMAGFPSTGEAGKIYVAKDTNKTYRWGGSAYVYITSGAVDSVSGKTGIVTLVKGDVGLGNVDNTADTTKNVLSASKLTTPRTINGTAFDGSANITITDSTKENSIASGSQTQYFRGDKTWQTLDKAATGLSNVDNTADATKNVLSASKLTTPRTINGTAFDGSANITINAVDATARIPASEKGVANGVATLDASGLIPTTQLPSYVDDVLEFTNLAGFPATGEAGKIYVAKDTNKTYRWGGSAYVYITSGAVDSVSGKTGIVTLVKGDVGLGSVDNTADATKNVLSASKLTTPRTINGTAFDGSANITITDSTKENSIAAGSQTQYFRGDKTWQDLSTAVRTSNLTGFTSSSGSVSASDTVLSAIQKVDGNTNLKLPLTGGTITGNLNLTGNLDGTSSSLITDFILDTHPESSSVIVPFMNNDISYLTLRGGTASATDNIGTVNPNIFDGTPSYTTFNPTTWGTHPEGYVIEMTFHKNFNYSSKVGVSFGNAGWRSKYVKIEMYDAVTQVYSTALETSTNASQIVQVAVSPGGSGTNGFSKMRMTFNDFQTANNFRIAQIWLVNFSSAGIKEIALGRDGGTLYGQLTGTTATFNTVNGSLNGNASSATKLATARTINNVAFDGTSNIVITDSTKQNIGATFFVGTTSIANNRASASQTLTGVSIDGNAATVGNILPSQIVSGTTNSATSNGRVDLNTLTKSGFYTAGGGATNCPETGRLILTGYDNATNIYRGNLLLGDSGDFWTRTEGGTTNSWTSWRKSLDSSNFNLYTPTLTGTGASGTWGINITGNSNTATTLQTARTINGVSFNGSANITINAVDSTSRIASSEKGTANGVATLDASGLIPTSQLPSYVDDVLEYTNLAGFPATGETGKIYVAKDTNKTYRWGGSAYVYITSGAVDSVSGKTGVVTLVKGDVGLGNVDNTSDATKNVLSATKLTTARTINNVAFDGSANITIVDATKQAIGSTFFVGTTSIANNRASASQTLTGVSIDGNAETSTSTKRISFVDGPRTLSDRLPNSFARTVNFDFVNASVVGGSGNYGGVMTFAPWDGLTTSTGDSSYQLAFRNESGTNGSGLPGLRLRKGIDTTWGSWYDMIHSGNYNSYSPTLTGAGASGTWGINISGSVSGSSRYVDLLANRTDVAAYPILWGTNQATNPLTGNASTYAFSCDAVKIQSSTGTVIANSFSGNSFISKPNSDSKTLYVGNVPSATTTQASIAVSNGNLYLDAANTYSTYINCNSGYMTLFGNGAGGPSGAYITTSGVVTGSSLVSSSTVTANQYFNTSSGAGNGYGFWSGHPSSYGILMSDAGNGSYGGRISGETSSDYNMYFSMAQGTNRGFVFRNGTTAIASINADGLRTSSDIIAFSSSDERLKDNVKKIVDPLKKLSLINGYTFDWNDKQSSYAGNDVGVIAQEIEKVMPQIVTTRDNGFKAVKYEKIVPLLIEVCKEQQAQIDDLKQLVNKLIK